MATTLQIATAAGPPAPPPAWIEPPPPAPLWLRASIVLALLGSVAVTFEPCLEASFVALDDDYVVANNVNYRGFSAGHLAWMFTSLEFGHYQPLTWLSYAVDDFLLNHVVTVNDEFVFHLTNVLLHAVSAVLCYLVARRLLASAAGTPWEYRRAPFLLGGATAAVLFALHPLRAESVAWVTERRDTLAMVFYLACVLAYLRYARRGGVWRYLVVMVLLALSLLAKAAAITLPVALLVLDVYPLRRLGRVRRADDPPPAPGRGPYSAARLVGEKLPLLVLLAAAAVMAYQAQRVTGAAYTLDEYDLPARLAQAVYGLMFYVQKTLVPINLGPMVQLPARSVLLGDMFTIAAVAVGVGLLAALLLVRRQPYWLAAAFVYLVTVAPVLGLAQSGPQLVADRYSYFSCIAWAVLGGALIATLARRARESVSARRAANVAGAAAMVLAALMSRATSQQCDVWQWDYTLWMRAVETAPTSSIAHAKYADAMANMAYGRGERAMLEAAAGHYRTSLELNPRDVITWMHLAKVLSVVYEIDDAQACYEVALELDPGHRGLHDEYANYLVRLRQFRRALEVFQDGTRHHPDDSRLALQLAELLATVPTDELRDAAAALAIAQRLNALTGGEDYSVLETLAAAHASAGQFEQAIAVADHAASLALEHGDTRAFGRIADKTQLFRDGKPVRMGE